MSDVTTIDTRQEGRSGGTPELDGIAGPRTVEESVLQPHQRETLELYQRAREAQGAIQVEDPARLGGELVGTVGVNNSFLLPNGEALRDRVFIGLQGYSNPQLHEMRYSAENGGFWLRFSGEHPKANQTKEMWVLVLDGVSGKNAITTFTPSQKEQQELYRAARKAQRAIEIGDPARLGEKLVGTGGLNKNFLLPNGENLGELVSIGLQGYSNPQLHDMRYSAEDGGFWSRFSGENPKTNQTKEMWVLVLDGVSGKDAITTFTLSQKKQHKLYRAARKAQGATEIGDPAWLGEKLVGRGGLNQSFLLPNGEKLGESVSIGLQRHTNPQPHEMRYSAEDGGFWLRFSGENPKTKQTKEMWVLVLDGTSGKAAIKTFSPRRNYLEPHQKELFDLYRDGKKTGRPLPFKNPNAARADLVATSTGRLQTSFLLPNGKPLQKPASIGLPKKCTNPQFHDLRYSAEDQGFWIKVSAQKNGRTTVIEFLVSDDPNVEGKAAILKTRKLGLTAKKKHELPPKFRRDRVKGELHAVKRKGNPGDADTEVRSKTAVNSVTFVKGEAFEQLIGIALALKYPGEEIVPQFCLRVGLNSEGAGYYGMRADFRVGKDKIIEVKWGRATNNIIETYTRHSEQLDKNGNPQPSYEVIMLEENPELRARGMPYALFSQFVEGLNPEARMLISKTQELIARLVDTGDRPQLERVRDFLYGALAELRDGGQGARRTEKLNDALLSLLIAEENNRLTAYLEKNTTIHFNSLEANFEWEGQLRSDCIDPTQYYLEHPESYELTYIFDTHNSGSPQRLRFAEQLARDLAVAQEILCQTTEKFPANGEVIHEPVFTFSPDISVTTQSALATVDASSGVLTITELAELREILQSTGLNTSDEWFGDRLGFAEAWVKRFPVRA